MLVNAIVLLWLVAMFIGGFVAGTMRQLWSLAVVAVSTFVASSLYLSFIAFTSGLVRNDSGSKILSFIIVFFAIGLVLGGPVAAIIGRTGSRPRYALGFDDALGGGILGVIIAISLVEVGTVVIITYPVLGWVGWIKSSRLIQQFFIQFPIMMPLMSSEFQQAFQLLR
jgi:hypothetical protein